MSAFQDWLAQQDENDKYRERMERAAAVAETRKLTKVGAQARARLQRFPVWLSAYCQCFVEDHHA